jgi:hypothetical protein
MTNDPSPPATDTGHLCRAARGRPEPEMHEGGPGGGGWVRARGAELLTCPAQRVAVLSSLSRIRARSSRISQQAARRRWRGHGEPPPPGPARPRAPRATTLEAFRFWRQIGAARRHASSTAIGIRCAFFVPTTTAKKKRNRFSGRLKYIRAGHRDVRNSHCK